MEVPGSRSGAENGSGSNRRAGPVGRSASSRIGSLVLWRRGSPPQGTGPFGPRRKTWKSRHLLSKVVSGTDSDGDTWTLQLFGPGSLTVVKQNDPTTGEPAALNSPTEINQIIVGGTDPNQSRLVGTVTKGPTGSDGQVFFQDLTELTSRSEILGAGNGLLAINMPNFWLGNTTPATSSTTPTTPAISIPDGVDTFRFGGVDTTHNQINPPASTAHERQLRGHPRPASARRDPDHHRQVDQQHPVGHRLRLDDADDHPARRDLRRLGPARPVPGQRDLRRRE